MYKSPDSDLRKYFQTMATAIGKTVYDRVPDAASWPYVHISDLNDGEGSTSTENLYNCEILFDIVTSFDGNHGGRKDCDTIGNAIMNYINNNYVDIGDFQIVQAQMVASNYVDEPGDTHNIYRKLLRIEIIVEQL